MSVSLEVENNGAKFTNEMLERMPGWIQFATGESAIGFRDFVTPWVYSSVGFKKNTGKLGQSIYAGLKKKGGRFTDEWVVGPKPTHFNWVAKWMPSSPKYAGFDHDFLHKAWASFTATNNIRDNVSAILKEKIDGLK